MHIVECLWRISICKKQGPDSHPPAGCWVPVICPWALIECPRAENKSWRCLWVDADLSEVLPGPRWSCEAVSKASMSPCLRMLYIQGTSQLLAAFGEGSYCNDHFLWTVLPHWHHVLSLSVLSDKLSFLLCFFPFASSQVLTLGFFLVFGGFFGRKPCSNQACLFWQNHRVCSEPASCLPTWFLFLFFFLIRSWQTGWSKIFQGRSGGAEGYDVLQLFHSWV